MDSPKPLATESFSYSWLTDTKPPSFDSLSNNLVSIFPQDSIDKEQNFDFDISVTNSPFSLVHADEIFSGGHIMPVYVKRSRVEGLRVSTSVPSSPLTFFDAQNKSQHVKWKFSSKRILQKWFGFVKPLCKIIVNSKKSNRVEDFERKVCEVQSLASSPRRSTAYSGKKGDLCNGLKRAKSWSSSPMASPQISPSRASKSLSCDDEISINEAILYCKRSIGMSAKGSDPICRPEILR